MPVALREAQRSQARVEGSGHQVDAAGNRLQPVGTVVHGIHRRHVRQQRLRGADVRGRLLAPDVLFARRQRHPVRRAAVDIHRDADDATRGVAHERVARGEERGVRPSVAKRHAKPLGVAEHHIGAHFSRRGDERKREQIRAHRHEDARLVRTRDERFQIRERAGGVGVLQQRAEHAAIERHRVDRADVELDFERLRARSQDVDRLGKARVAHQEQAALAVAGLVRPDAVQQRHGLGGGRGLVQQRRVRHFHPREVGDHRLKIEQRFEAPLRDLGLIRGVRRVPARVFHHHPQDHARRDRVVVAEADVRPEHPVPAGQVGQALQVLEFTLGRRKVQRLTQPDRRRDRLVDQRVERCRAERREHLVALVRRGPDVAPGEPVGPVEEVHHDVTRVSYCALSSSDDAAPGSVRRTLTIHVPCGS
jgi:hypothetical protein